MNLFAGIDIGSTCAKTIVLNEDKEIVFKDLVPTGWSSIQTAGIIKKEIESISGYDENNIKYVATGYGRISVPYADKMITEISCHGSGAANIFKQKNCLIIDIGGQDTKIISISDGVVNDFVMNDKCSAGTGRFLEIMSNTMGMELNEMCELARLGSGVSISSMCTVFAESEVISLIGNGTEQKDIAFGVVESITSKVRSQCGKLLSGKKDVFLTGGLCEIDYILESLSGKVGIEVKSNPLARYAGAFGAALKAITL